MNRRLLSCCLAIACLSVVAGCGGGSEEQAPGPSALVELHPAESRDFQQTVTAYGSTEPAASAVSGVTVQYEARVADVYITNGQTIETGKPLFRLAASAASQLELDKAARDATLASQELARTRRLREQGMATDADVQTATNAETTSREQYASLKQRMGEQGLHVVTAARAGAVDSIAAKPGDVVAAGTLLARITTPGHLVARVGIEPGEADKVAVGQPAVLTPVTGRGQPATGQVTSIDTRIDPQTRQATAIVDVPERSGLLANEAVSASIIVETHGHAIGVPRSAVLHDGDKAQLFVAEQGVAHRREVQIGIEQDGWTEVTSGLSAGEQVVASGNYELSDGMAIRVAGGAGS